MPPGFVVRTDAFERFVQELEREGPVRSRVAALRPDELAQIDACSQDLRRRFAAAALPAELAAAVTGAHATLVGDADVAVAIRSSATTEDAADASFAGLQDTYLWITTPADVLARLRDCWSSLYSVESISYRRRLRIPEAGVAMAVVVQTMVDARSAGVMFTRSPTTGDRSVITVEGAWGLGSAVVGGEVTPDRWVIGKITGDISVRTISGKEIEHIPAAAGGVATLAVSGQRRRTACMSDAELQALRAIGRKVERHYNGAQDLEWAVDRHSGEILLLQSRPETVWSAI